MFFARNMPDALLPKTFGLKRMSRLLLYIWKNISGNDVLYWLLRILIYFKRKNICALILKWIVPLSAERRFGWQRRRSGQRSKLELCQKGWSSLSFSPTLEWKTKKLHLFDIGLRRTLFYLKDHQAIIASPGVRQLRKFGITLEHRRVCRRRSRRCDRSIHEA